MIDARNWSITACAGCLVSAGSDAHRCALLLPHSLFVPPHPPLHCSALNLQRPDRPHTCRGCGAHGARRGRVHWLPGSPRRNFQDVRASAVDCPTLPHCGKHMGATSKPAGRYARPVAPVWLIENVWGVAGAQLRSTAVREIYPKMAVVLQPFEVQWKINVPDRYDKW